jgi:A/G-specific adenine glycosylase
MADFNPLIKDWYRLNKRRLPWRLTKDPFKIWLSEIILQQTKVEQGLSYYLKFTNRFQTVEDLAKTTEQEVLNLWQGLGYYSRARNLHFTAKTVVNEHKGKFPKTYTELLKLKGVGSYTAAAIASFCFDESVAVVDGNVYRVLSRVFDLEIAIDSSEGKKYFFELAQNLIDKEDPALFNQAIMEFGALQCVPKNPNCEICPLDSICLSKSNGTWMNRPVKSKKTSVKHRFFHFLIFQNDQTTYLQKRSEKDIWQNLFQFPLIETDEDSEINTFENYTLIPPSKISAEIVHVLSHQKIHARFYHFNHLPSKIDADWMAVKMTEIQDYPIPRLIDRYLETESLE